MDQQITPTEAEQAKKLLGAQIDIEVYWAFKKAAADRQETMTEAVTHAARMYIDIEKGE